MTAAAMPKIAVQDEVLSLGWSRAEAWLKTLIGL